MTDTTLSPQQAWKQRHECAELCLHRVIADISEIIIMSKNKSINMYLDQVLTDLKIIQENHTRAKDEIIRQIHTL